MKLPSNQYRKLSFAARWTSRIALFSASVLFVGLLAHRLFSMPTPIVLNIVKFTMLGAVIAIILAIAASVSVWRNDTTGVPRILTGLLVSLALLAWPLSQYKAFTTLPEIHDITTDWTNPPQFKALAKERGADANAPGYGGKKIADQQRRAYPDLVALNVNRSPIDAFEIVADAMKRRGLTIVSESIPGPTPDEPGHIEAFDRTLVLGFYDDVVVRIRGDLLSSRIDVRSASRYGRHDLGQNAIRVRELLKEIVVRLEASVPSARERKQTRKKKQKTKKKKSR